MQVQIQALLVRGVGGEAVPREVGRQGGGIKIAKPQIFDGTPSKVTRFITACKLYIRMRMREKTVMILILRIGYKNNSCIRETQENLIKSSLQNSLPYILLLLVHANYYAPYPK